MVQVLLEAVLRNRDGFIPDPIFSIPDPGTRVDRIPDPEPHQRIYVKVKD